MLIPRRHLNAVEARRYRLVQLVVAALTAAMVLALGMFLGYTAAYRGLEVDPDRYREMESEIPRLEAQISDLRVELGGERTRREIDRQSLEMVRREIAGQKDHIAVLDEGLQFYKSLMAPGELAQGLSLRPLELVALEVPGRYAFRIVAQQEALKHALLKGELFAEVVGLHAGQEVSYPLAELSEDVGELKIPLRFRYFQSIEGELGLPEDFEPKSVSLVATATAPRKAEVREQFPWRVRERFTHVGK